MGELRHVLQLEGFFPPKRVEVNNKWLFMLMRLKVCLKAVNFQQCCALFATVWAELAGKNSCMHVLITRVFLSESLELFVHQNFLDIKVDKSWACPITFCHLWTWVVGSCVHEDFSVSRWSLLFTFLHYICYMRVSSKCQLKKEVKSKKEKLRG